MSMPVSTHLLPKSTLRAAVDGDGDALWQLLLLSMVMAMRCGVHRIARQQKNL